LHGGRLRHRRRWPDLRFRVPIAPEFFDAAALHRRWSRVARQISAHAKF
jgi:hypothetical protein